MKKVLQNNKKTKEYLESLPKYYVLCLWAHYGILSVPFSGECDKQGVPLVWSYFDFNGEADEYHLKPITYITTGGVYAWATCEKPVQFIADELNGKEKS